ncbi:UNVERIFIED_ORG: hypothetical protein J2Y81_000767 [Paraburkholderia sediminicola]|nr:hypothetical protein [Paraburkholderia sediminicola]
MLSDAEYHKQLESEALKDLGALISGFESKGDFEGLMTQLGHLVRVYEVVRRVAGKSQMVESARGAALGGVANYLKSGNLNQIEEPDEERATYEFVRDSFEQAFHARGLGGVMWSIHEISRALRKSTFHPGEEGKKLTRRTFHLALRDLEEAGFCPKP